LLLWWHHLPLVVVKLLWFHAWKANPGHDAPQKSGLAKTKRSRKSGHSFFSAALCTDCRLPANRVEE
jgi:hypothetical protein